MTSCLGCLLLLLVFSGLLYRSGFGNLQATSLFVPLSEPSVRSKSRVTIGTRCLHSGPSLQISPKAAFYWHWEDQPEIQYKWMLFWFLALNKVKSKANFSSNAENWYCRWETLGLSTNYREMNKWTLQPCMVLLVDGIWIFSFKKRWK